MNPNVMSPAQDEDRPWNDWIPGVLSRRQVKVLCENDYIKDAVIGAIDHSAIDLHVSNEAYEFTNGSVKPFGDRYLLRIEKQKLVKRLDPQSDGSFLLQPKKTYLFKTKESLFSSAFRGSPIYGQATAKSSVGRLDVLARLIVDGMDSYEEFDPKRASKGTGEMFLEVTPITFKVRVKEGVALSQLRFFCGKPSNAEVRGEALYRTLLKDTLRRDGTLSVDLSNVEVSKGQVAAAYRAKSDEYPDAVRLWKDGNVPLPNPSEYWELKAVDEQKRLTIKGSDFYILRSKEKIAVPPGIAVYCRAIDETIGEIRIHYAGFVHPFFGRNRDDDQLGTPLIFEVRGHDIDVNLKDGEKLARLTFYRMSEDAKMEKEEEEKSKKADEYKAQTLKLSHFFGKWPEK